MSVPTDIYDILNGSTVYEVSPFVRPHGKDFPCVVYTFDGDTFEGSRYGDLGARRVEVTAHCLARVLGQAETASEQLLVGLAANDCVRVTRVDREYDPSYDGQRSGLYDVSITFIYFKG